MTRPFALYDIDHLQQFSGRGVAGDQRGVEVYDFLSAQKNDPNPVSFFQNTTIVDALNVVARDPPNDLTWEMFMVRPMIRTAENPFQRKFMTLPEYQEQQPYTGPLIKLLDGRFSFLARNFWLEIEPRVLDAWNEEAKHHHSVSPILSIQFFDPDITTASNLVGKASKFSGRPRREPFELTRPTLTRIECRYQWCLINCGRRWQSAAPLFHLGPLLPTNDPNHQCCIFGRALPGHLQIHPQLEQNMTPVDSGDPCYAQSAAVLNLAWVYIWRRKMEDTAILGVNENGIEITPKHRLRRLERRFTWSFRSFKDLFAEIIVCTQRAEGAKREKRRLSSGAAFIFDGSFLDALREQEALSCLRWQRGPTGEVAAYRRSLASPSSPILQGQFYRRRDQEGTFLLFFTFRIMFLVTPDWTVPTDRWSLYWLEIEDEQIEWLNDAQIKFPDDTYQHFFRQLLQCTEGPFSFLRPPPPPPPLPSSSASAPSSPWNLY